MRFFKDCQSLMQHLRKEHDMGNLLRILTPTNQCMWCASTFANRMTAQQHVISAYECGRCIADMSIANHPVVEPASLTCKVCGFTSESWLQLRVHLAKHVRAPSHIWLDDIQCSALARGCSDGGRGKRKRVHKEEDPDNIGRGRGSKKAGADIGERSSANATKDRGSTGRAREKIDGRCLPYIRLFQRRQR